MKPYRSSGILLHTTSLPGPLEPEAYRFVDFLHETGQRLWQILPLGPPGFGNNPYVSASAFAGNPDLVVKAKESTSEAEAFQAFCQRNAYWLDDYARFTSDSDRRLQYHFFKQWIALKKYANQKGIKIVGDIPIYVALDSADVRAHPELFQLDKKGNPTVVAGVPPDYFSKTGQLWGNPIYRWDVMAKTGYRWWIERFRVLLQLVDIVRIDHFRAFESYWEVPATEKTAINGRWVKGPGAGFFEALQKEFGELSIIAEDLGMITEEVYALRDQFGFPGMKVLQFSFGGDPKDLPDYYPENCVVYTGTHDNNTTVGWFRGEGSSTLTPQQRREERNRLLTYLGTDGSEIHWDLIRVALSSKAKIAIIPMQDVLGLGSEARMNTPGTTEGNWRWRFSWDQLTPEAKKRLKELTLQAGRGQKLSFNSK